MSVKKFKFVSPGVFTKEIDNSQLPAADRPAGPVIVGRLPQGPAMEPVKIRSGEKETFKVQLMLHTPHKHICRQMSDRLLWFDSLDKKIVIILAEHLLRIPVLPAGQRKETLPLVTEELGVSF